MRGLKRLFDVFFAFFFLIVFSPLLVVCATAILYFDGAPILYMQRRPGRKGRLFTIFKFRTMKAQTGDSGEHDTLRITRLGNILRKTSMDELPQLWNVLIGDMSLVGPRPLLEEYLPLYSERQLLRHDVRPGITGWAQVNGRNAVDWSQRLELDSWYVENWSFLLDVRILFKTLSKVFVRSEVNFSGELTMEPFKGSKDENGKS